MPARAKTPRKPAKGSAPRDQTALFAHLIVKHATDSMVFTDANGLTLWANDPFTKMSGYRPEELIGKTPGAVLQGPDTDPATVARIRAAIETRQTIRTDLLNYAKDGTPYWIDLTITPVYDDNGTLTHFMSIERDVTQARELAQKTEAALAKERQRRRERRLLSKMSEWLFTAQDMNELQQVVSRAMGQLFPGTDGALYIFSNSRDILELSTEWGAAPQPAHLKPDDCWALRRGRAYSYGASDIDLPCPHVSDEENVSLCMPIIAHGNTIGLLSVHHPDTPVTAWRAEASRKQLQQDFELALICAEQISLAAANVRLQTELQDRSVKDPLTGLWNRRWFMDMATSLLRRPDHRSAPITLMMLDLDKFKSFNDEHGHDAGDAVLKAFTERLTRVTGGSAHACRLGGEEFAVLFGNADADDAQVLYRRLQSDLETLQVHHRGITLPPVTVSGGISQLKPDQDLGQLMRHADLALYVAKGNGRNRVELYDAETPDMPEQARLAG